MAVKDNNRYALFREGNNDAPTPSPPTDPSLNPFLNQIAESPTPWQEVKKKGAPAVQPPKVLRVVESSRTQTARNRAYSMSTTGSSEKVPDPHENWCGVCNQKFANKVALQNHVKQSPNHKHYCNLCKRVFKDRNGLQNHVDNAADHDVFCNLCLSAFNDEWGLKNHFENNYAVGHEFACLTCLLGFKSQRDLRHHLQTAAKHTWCDSCKRRFRDQDERDEHWRITTKHKHCLQLRCDFDGPDQAALDMHLERDHFHCAGCHRIFPSQTKLTQHMQACKFAVSCPHCGVLCSGQVELEIHLKNCFYCKDCQFCTSHEGKYNIHMTKHADANIACWGCDKPMKTFSSMINHLESGSCTNMPDPGRLLLCLGRWWYSPLYMDISIHAQLRTGRADPKTLLQWMADGVLQPFICRQEHCMKQFARMSSLVLHCESNACEWDVTRLNMPGLEKEVKQTCVRRDSGSGSGSVEHIRPSAQDDTRKVTKF